MGYSYHQRAQNFGLNLNIYGPLGCDITLSQLQDFFRFRKAEFVDNLGWSIAYSGTMEHDQYDLPLLNIVWRTKRMNALAVRALCPQAQKFK